MAVAKQNAAGQITDNLPTAAVNADVKRDFAGQLRGELR